MDRKRGRTPVRMPGEDDGCFQAAFNAVTKWGGVIEHPAYSAAFMAHGIAPPPTDGAAWTKNITGGWTCWVAQGLYGHKSEKPTWLYYQGKTAPPTLRWGRFKSDHKIVRQLWNGRGSTNRSRYGNRPTQNLSRSARIKTPPEFAELLVSLARAA